MYSQDSYYTNKPRVKLYFDIETLPAPEEDRDLVIELGIQKEKRKFPKKAIRLTKNKKEEIYRFSAISGDFGRICCIGYAIDNQKSQIITGSEVEILEKSRLPEQQGFFIIPRKC